MLRWQLGRCTVHGARQGLSAPSRGPAVPVRGLATSGGVPVTPESSVARGTRFELLCQDLLRHMFGMKLERTGGAGDKGIDLRGWWTPPAPSNLQQDRRIRVIAQCKCQDEGGKKMGPVLIREVEGVLHRANSPAPSSDGTAPEPSDLVAGIILSSSGFSKQAVLQVRSSILPLVAIHVKAEEPPNTNNAPSPARLDDRCLSIVWNERFGSRQHGLFGEELEVRWQRSLNPHASADRPVIFRSGKPLT